MKRNPDAGVHRRAHASIGKNTMLGPGGEIVEPRSESNELLRVFRLLEGGNVERAKELVMRLYDQVRKGYHRNPRGGGFKAGDVVALLGTDVHDIRYTHAEDGGDYEHKFNGEAEVYAVIRNGKRELLISHNRGLPLWDDF
jgi:hypothetical protein